MQTQLEPLKSVEEIAAYLKITTRTVYRLITEGDMPHRKIGGSIRFDMAEIEAWSKKDKKPIASQ